MRLYFVRHGESEANVLNEISNRGYKHGLTDKGHWQVELLAQKLLPAKAAKIFSSPLLRAVQTAEILSTALQVEIEITSALREFDCGVIEGKSDPESWATHRWMREEWLRHQHWESKIEQGESFLDIRQRFEPFINHLLEQGRHSDENIILIGHGGLYICMLPVVLANIDFDFAASHPFPNTAYVLAQATSAGLACLEWCGTIVYQDSPGCNQ